MPSPPGIPVGAFRLRTDITAEALFSDNAGQDETHPRADIGQRLRASLALESNWPRHSLRAALDVTETAWRETGLDALEVSTGLDLRFDLAAGHILRATAGWTLAPEQDGPERLTHSLAGGLRWEATSGILRPSLGAEVTRRDYTNRVLDGGRVTGTGDDDYTEPAVAFRLLLDRGGRLRPFAGGSYSWRLHDSRRDASGRLRDSHGGDIEAGIELDDAIWSGRLALRYATRSYDDPATGTVRGLGLDAALTWRPDRLLTIDMSAGLAIDETTEAGATAVRRHTAALRATHALRENITITAGLGAEYADYASSPDHELRLTGELSAELTMRHGLSLIAGWQIERQWSTLPGGDYLENRLRLGLRHRF
jgi:hypothetical protein